MGRKDGGLTTGPGRALPFGILVLDEQGTILRYGRAAEKIGDGRLDGIVGKNFFREVTPCAQVASFGVEYPRAVCGVGEIGRFHVNFPYPNGSRKVTVMLVAYRDKHRLRCLVVTGDLTES